MKTIFNILSFEFCVFDQVMKSISTCCFILITYEHAAVYHNNIDLAFFQLPLFPDDFNERENQNDRLELNFSKKKNCWKSLEVIFKSIWSIVIERIRETA